VAANLAGTAFSHSMVGCVHGMAHASGALYHVPHGIANAILLTHGMEYNFDEIKEKLTKLTPFMGVEISGLSVEDSAAKAIEAVRSLTVKLNGLGALPLRLRDVGVPEEGLPELAEYAVNDGTSWFNPREVVAEEILLYLKNAY
jgi:alcohol dehydrogenase class IV